MLMRNYFLSTPDPDRGYALAALTDGLPISFPLRRVLAEIGESRFDPDLFRMSRDDVGDTAETVALIWPVTEAQGDAPRLPEIVAALSRAGRGGHAALLTQWLDRLDATGRWALLKFLSGAPRVGVSARLAKQAVADAFGKSVDDIEELWHGLEPPYTELFDWLEQKAERPSLSAIPIFRPLMLAHALEEGDWQAMKLEDFAAEWKWDGIRIQVAAKGGTTRLFSRTGDDIGQAFPELLDHFRFDAVLDGELLVVRDGHVAPFGDLQQRLNRKSVTRAMLTKYPVHVRFYDALEIGGEDLRGLPFTARRSRLEAWHAAYGPALQRSLRTPRLRQQGGAQGPLGGNARGRHRRPDAEAQGEPLSRGPPQGPLVQVEARGPHRGLRAALCPEGLRQALLLLFGLHFRRLDGEGRRGHARPRRQGLFGFHR